MNTVKRQLKTTYFPFRSCCNLSFTCKECCTQCTTHSHLSHTKVKLCITFVPFNCMTLCWGIVSRHTETISYLHIPGCPRGSRQNMKAEYQNHKTKVNHTMKSEDKHELENKNRECKSWDKHIISPGQRTNKEYQSHKTNM
jgi:hypothetical protein